MQRGPILNSTIAQRLRLFHLISLKDNAMLIGRSTNTFLVLDFVHQLENRFIWIQINEDGLANRFSQQSTCYCSLFFSSGGLPVSTLLWQRLFACVVLLNTQTAAVEVVGSGALWF